MDFVDKYEGRTLWSSSGTDLESKFGATTVILRARPAGQSHLVLPLCSADGDRFRINGPSYHPSNTYVGRNQGLFSHN